MQSSKLFLLVLTLANAFVCGERLMADKEYPPFDGWYNNRAYPQWGATDTILSRLMHPVYSDGVFVQSGTNRPNARLISRSLMDGESGLPSVNNKTVFFAFFGQFIFNEIVDVKRMGCPPEHFHIKVPPFDFFDPEGKGYVEMPFQRSRYDQDVSGYYTNHPREQLNQVTTFMDGGNTYGNLRTWANLLRLRKSFCADRTPNSHLYANEENPRDCRGELASLNDEGLFPIKNDIGMPLRNPFNPRDLFTPPVQRYYRLGDRMGNESPFMLSLEIMWFRHHNYLANELRKEHDDWDDHTVFLEAKIRNVAIFQKIAMYDWLPIFLGNCTTSSGEPCDVLGPYKAYDPIVLCGITNVFQGAAMRYLFTLFPPGVFIRSRYDQETGKCQFYNMTRATAGKNLTLQRRHEGKPALRLCNSYWNANEAVDEYGIAPIIMGMASQIAEREDHVFTPDYLTNYHGPRHFTRTDFMALAVHLGRDHGLVDYNAARQEFGFPELTNFEDINPELFGQGEYGAQLLKNLTDVHSNSLDVIDIMTGGILETKDGIPGGLFRHIILDQFRRIRDGDRFWFENTENKLLTEEERQAIYSTTIRDVILRTNPDLDGNFDIQDNPFLWNQNGDQKLFCPQPFQLKASDMEECVPLHKYDYFEGSDIPFIALYCTIGAFVFSVIAFMYMIGHTKQKTRKRQDRNDLLNNNKASTKLCTSAVEILGRHTTQKVKVKLGPNNIITVISLERERKMEIKGTSFVYLSTDKNNDLMLIKNDHATYDLVLSFSKTGNRELFLDRLRGFLVGDLSDWELYYIKQSELFHKAYTKEQRDKALTKFFRIALSNTMISEHDELEQLPEKSKMQKFINMKISKYEFAEFIKMKEDSLFLNHLFNKADQDNDDLISFGELRNIIVLFTTGSDPEEKLKLMFDIFDLSKTGLLSPDEFREMVRSMIESFSTRVKIEDLNRSITRMMENTGCDEERGLTYDDFKNFILGYPALVDEQNNARNPPQQANRRHSVAPEFHDNMRRVSVASIIIPDSNANMRRMSSAAITIPDRMIKGMKVEKPQKNTRRFSVATMMGSEHQHLRDLSDSAITMPDLESQTTKKGRKQSTTRSITSTRDFDPTLGQNKRRESHTVSFVPVSVELRRRRLSAIGTAFDRTLQASIRQLERNVSVESDERAATAADAATAEEVRREGLVMNDVTMPKKYKYNSFARKLISFEKYIEYHTLEIFWFIVYSGATAGVFMTYFFRALYNHSAGWLAVSEYAIPMAYGSAGAMMFNLSTLLLTMCRNTITYMRDTWLSQYVPFDEAMAGHKIVAWMALCFCVSHVMAQAVNFYAIATQYAEDLLCLFPDYWYPSDYYPSFIFWSMKTLTGITGILLIVTIVIVYVFASEYARERIYAWFSWTHTVGIFLLYFFIALHGNGMMLQSPTFFFYFFGPLKVYLIDKIYQFSRRKIEISVVKAELLPSNVTNLQFKRPQDFIYKAGQWVKIACIPLSPEEFHPFTLTSAPHEEFLSVHVRAVGPWTKNLRRVYDKENLGDSPYPKLYVDGPYGEGHQDWYKTDVTVLIGGGIGVTPFAAILKDWISSSYIVGMNCKRIYFLWITRDQKQYEWLTDIIQKVEEQDTENKFRAHIFVTQFPQQFDLRTTMLYICEKNFHKVAGKSMFTGLKSETHFGRPNFLTFFQYLADQHHDIKKLGVFSRGPRPMVRDVDKACVTMNQYKGPIFSHNSR